MLSSITCLIDKLAESLLNTLALANRMQLLDGWRMVKAAGPGLPTACPVRRADIHFQANVLVGLLLIDVNIALQFGVVELTCCCLRKLWTRCIAASSWYSIRMGIAWAVASSMRLGRP